MEPNVKSPGIAQVDNVILSSDSGVDSAVKSAMERQRRYLRLRQAQLRSNAIIREARDAMPFKLLVHADTL